MQMLPSDAQSSPPQHACLSHLAPSLEHETPGGVLAFEVGVTWAGVGVDATDIPTKPSVVNVAIAIPRKPRQMVFFMTFSLNMPYGTNAP
jgi:hypothetical protein